MEAGKSAFRVVYHLNGRPACFFLQDGKNAVVSRPASTVNKLLEYDLEVESVIPEVESD